MKKIILGFFVFGLTIQSFAQKIDILEVHIAPASYQYIDKVAEDNAEVTPAEPVKLLQQKTCAL